MLRLELLKYICKSLFRSYPSHLSPSGTTIRLRTPLLGERESRIGGGVWMGWGGVGWMHIPAGVGTAPANMKPCTLTALITLYSAYLFTSFYFYLVHTYNNFSWKNKKNSMSANRRPQIRRQQDFYIVK